MYLDPLVSRFGLAACTVLAGLASARVAPAAQIQTVFVIAMENHDFTQPGSYTSIQPLLGNAAAPYLNSLVTPGNPNAQYSSYASNMTNVALGVHPSESNLYLGERRLQLRRAGGQRSLGRQRQPKPRPS